MFSEQIENDVTELPSTSAVDQLCGVFDRISYPFAYLFLSVKYATQPIIQDSCPLFPFLLCFSTVSQFRPSFQERNWVFYRAKTLSVVQKTAESPTHWVFAFCWVLGFVGFFGFFLFEGAVGKLVGC